MQALTTTSHEGHSGVKKSTEKSNERDKEDGVAALWGKTKKAGALLGEQKVEKTHSWDLQNQRWEVK